MQLDSHLLRTETRRIFHKGQRISWIDKRIYFARVTHLPGVLSLFLYFFLFLYFVIFPCNLMLFVKPLTMEIVFNVRKLYSLTDFFFIFRKLISCFAFCLSLAGFFFGLLFDLEDRGSTFLRNFGEIPNYISSHPRRQYCS